MVDQCTHDETLHNRAMVDRCTHAETSHNRAMVDQCTHDETLHNRAMVDQCTREYSEIAERRLAVSERATVCTSRQH